MKEDSLSRDTLDRDTDFSLGAARRLVVKVGTALLVEDGSGRLRQDWLAALTDDIAVLMAGGTQVMIVSSGAVAVGRHDLGLGARTLKLEEQQAAAAAGQIRLAHAWQEVFGAHDLRIAQILLTPGDTEERRRHLNARNTIETLLTMGAIPVINENDTVATEEIRFGDNDRLAARVAQMLSADMLVLLSDIDGLYTADPRVDADAVFIPDVPKITAEIEQMAGQARTGYSSGGMVTKIEAAKIATRAGCDVIIASGEAMHSLAAVGAGGRHTVFKASGTPVSARKRWIAGAINPAGAIIIDDGAQRALSRGTSLLPAGVVAVEGSFERGDTVLIQNREGRRLGSGLSAYSADDARLIAGHKSGEIETLLGYRGRDEMIHRNDLVLDEV